MSAQYTWLLLALVAAVATTCNAFSVVGSSSLQRLSASSPFIPRWTPLYQAEAEEGSEVAADAAQEEEVKEEEKEEKKEEKKENQEVTELKAKIAELEKTLKAKRSELQYVRDSADDYSKTGYARQVAQMENMKRVRSVSH